jgi:hypothetical protein
LKDNTHFSPLSLSKDPNYQTDFLLTFRSFTTPRELLELLIKRYNMPIPKGLSYGDLQDWKQSKQKPIRLRFHRKKKLLIFDFFFFFPISFSSANLTKQNKKELSTS